MRRGSFKTVTGLTYFGGSDGNISTTIIFIFGMEELDAIEVLYNHFCGMAYKNRSTPLMCSLMKKKLITPLQ